MIFSFKRLKKITNLHDKKIEDFVKAINNIGFEVESYKSFGNVSGIKFGKILEVKQNPNSNNLFVCKIIFSNNKIRTIQTSAKGIKINQIIIAFLPGSKMNDQTFKPMEFRKIISEGMLSSLNEFGVEINNLRKNQIDVITDYSNEISDLNIDPIEYLELNDFLIDVAILPNRADAASYYVMANEICAYFKKEFNFKQIKKSYYQSNLNYRDSGLYNEKFTLFEAKQNFKITIKEQFFLAKHNIKAFNNVEDLKNLTLLFSGQPLAIYDQEKIKNSFSIQKISHQKIKIDDEIIELNDDLVIVNNQKIVGFCGAKTLESFIGNDSSNNLVFELSHYPIANVRSNIKKLKINDQIANQATKKLEVGSIKLALIYLTNYLSNFSNIVNFHEPKLQKIKLDLQITSQIINTNLINNKKFNDAIESLKILGFKFEDLNEEIKIVTIPDYRYDIESQQDLDEEILRFYGYDHLKPVRPINSNIKVIETNDFKNHLAHLGYQEIVNYALIDSKSNHFNPFGFKTKISLLKSVSKLREEVRQSQFVSMHEIIKYNLKRKIPFFNFFSKGVINDNYQTIALASNTKTFLEIKKDVINVFKNNLKFIRFNEPQIHHGTSAKIFYDNKMIGWIGKPSPLFQFEDFIFAEILLDKMQFQSQKIIFKKYDHSPLSKTHLTIEFKKNESVFDFITKIKNYQLHSLQVIDKYQKDDVNKITFQIIASKSIIEKINKIYN